MISHYIEIIAAQQHQSWYKPNNFSCCFKHIKAHINLTISHLVKQDVRTWYLELFPKDLETEKHSEDSTIINQIRLIYTFWTINICNLESWWVQNKYKFAIPSSCIWSPNIYKLHTILHTAYLKEQMIRTYYLR
jgi:hypothetical protein